MRKNPSYMALLRPTRLLSSEKSATYMIQWSFTIIWQVKVRNLRSLIISRQEYFSEIMIRSPNVFINCFARRAEYGAPTAIENKSWHLKTYLISEDERWQTRASLCYYSFGMSHVSDTNVPSEFWCTYCVSNDVHQRQTNTSEYVSLFSRFWRFWKYLKILRQIMEQSVFSL